MVSLAPNPMPSYQYHFVVLARWPGRYDYLDKSLDCIRLRPLRDSEGWLSGQSIVYYRVVRGLPGKRPDLPSHALYWTSIACLLWDDAEPGLLDPEQQQALLDWLHWGGQIILSGPDTLDTLRGSFLEPYLPATAAGTRDLTAADLQPLQRWASNDGTSKSLRPLKPVKPWTGVKLQKHPAARFLPATDEETCELLAERTIGRGRIVVSAFRLSGADLTEWPGWDGLFNSCLLRHPGRSFQETKSGQLQVVWRRPRRVPAAAGCPAGIAPAAVYARCRYAVRRLRRRRVPRRCRQRMKSPRRWGPEDFEATGRPRTFRRTTRRRGRAWPPGTTSVPWPTPPARVSATPPGSRCPTGRSSFGWWRST